MTSGGSVEADVERIQAALNRSCDDHGKLHFGRRDALQALTNLTDRIGEAERTWKSEHAHRLADNAALKDRIHYLEGRVGEQGTALKHVNEHITHYPDQPLDKGCRDAISSALTPPMKGPNDE